ncbi:MAG TPA: two-component regulator propeller domain-containing protein [Phnomibacter sp.]|nr:two-component regulator propeller domain-containing protein [Phnomibacter sp.]
MNPKPKVIFILVFLIVLQQTFPSLSQPLTTSFRNYSTSDGLSSTTVYDILKDKYGFMWFATEDGLNRFDGSRFKVYRYDPANPKGLQANFISSLFESADGCIWIGTGEGGLSFYDRQKDSIYKYVTTGDKQVSNAINRIKGDRNGNIWVTGFGSLQVVNPANKELITYKKFGTIAKQMDNKVSVGFLHDRNNNYWIGTNEGLYHFNSGFGLKKVYKYQENDPASLPSNNIGDITQDKNGTIWIATDKGLAYLEPGQASFKKIDTKTNPNIFSNMVFAITADEKNRLWIGTDEGLNVMDIATRKIAGFTPDKRNPYSISSRSIRSIYIDKQGGHWVGTFRGGINAYNENLSYFNLKDYNAFDTYGLRSPMVTAFAAKNNEDIFVGTNDGGLQVFHRSTGLLDYVPLPVTIRSSNHDLSIMTLELGGDNQLWIGTFLNGLYAYNSVTGAVRHYLKGENIKDINNNDIFCLKKDSKGNLWVGTNGGGINIIMHGGNEDVVKYLQDPLRPLDPALPSSNYIRAFEEDRMGRMWIGTFGGGISVYDPKSQKFSIYNKDNSSLPGNFIIALLEDKAGNIWVGTTGNGIALLKKGSTSFTVLTEKDGLANTTINKIIEDDAGKIWISTNNGISSYDPVHGKFKNYHTYNGLQPGSFVPRSGIKMPDGSIFFGGQKGFNFFNPASLIVNKNIPPVVFTEFKIDNQAIAPSENGPITQSIELAETIRLKYKQSFSISFESLCYNVPEANQYQYQLEGFDNKWLSTGKEHRAYYANLPPGTYTFRVKASNNDGIWNEEGKSIIIKVSPPFWRSIYAYIVYLLLAFGMMYYLRHRSMKKIQARFALEQERKNAREEIHRQRKEAEYLRNLDQQKIKFLTNLSHEFKTPLSLIIGPVEALAKHIKEEVSINQLNLVKRNTKRLLNLVNQLLDFRKMEEKELKLQCSEGDLVSFLQESCENFRDLAHRKKIGLGFYSTTPTLVSLFDHDKMERIIFNLLSNAFKFTKANGDIAISLKVSEGLPTEDNYKVSISVKDSGIGFPPSVKEHIFESFYQHDDNSEILNQGTGIGLSIVKEFVQIHNGTIWVDSEDGKGSCFTFELNLKRPESISPRINENNIITENGPQYENISKKESTDQATPHYSTKPAILVVEDDDDFRYYLKDNLESSYRIFEAANGKEGWQRTLFHHPDVLVCDIQMPVMNGLELVQKLKADKRTKHIPVILLTAANTPSGMLDGLESGAIDYITKPFDFAILQAKINNLLLLNQSYKDTYSKQVTVSLPETEVVSESEKFLQRTVAYIYENLDNSQLSVETLSTHMHLSRASMYNKLLEYTGMSPVEFIRSVKLDKAKELLEKSDLTVTEIAYETGFANPNYFTKVFKKKHNNTPSEYLNEKRGK